MTGSGTQTDPYIVDSWAEFESVGINSNSSVYVHINPDEQDLMFELVKDMNDYDFQLITKFLTEYLYAPRFGAKTKCPNCRNDLVLDASIDELVFLVAQDITAEIL